MSREIDLDEDRLEQLKSQLSESRGEFETAEAEFRRLDERHKELTQELEALDPAKQPEEAKRAAEASADFEGAWKAAEDRFQLALEERSALQEQIALLERKLAGDQVELARLKGEAPPAPREEEPAPEESPAAETAPGGPSPADPPGAFPWPFLSRDAAPGADPSPTSEAPKSVTPPVSQTVQKAREEAEATRQTLAEAASDIQRTQARLDDLDELIEHEQRLLETRRQMAQNARRRLAELTEEYRQRVAQEDPADLAELTQQIAEAEAAYRAAQLEVDQSQAALQRAQSRREALAAQLAQAQSDVRRMEREANVTWFKSLGIEAVEWLKQHGVRLLVILLGFIVLEYLIRIGSKRIFQLRIRADRGRRQERENRAKTLASVFSNAATMVAAVGAVLLVVAEINPDWIAPLIASLAVVGIAVGLGAQDLIRDYFFGFVMLLENQYRIDDIVKIGDVVGSVERVTLRMTVLRDLDGVVHFVPHGQIKTVTNLTHGWSRALFEVGVAYKEDVDQVMEVLTQLGREIRDDPKFGPLILDDLEMLGVDAFGDSAVVIKFFIKTRPLEQFPVRRELNRRIKNRFDELGIEIPFPHRTVYHREAPDARRPYARADR
ncbi:MAG: mechanosensitive ion channel [Planctomycetes bacterium]|nr:mechanosensitive ion channel [Planctomycetota bacterium]